jgi:hypothetical protein
MTAKKKALKDSASAKAKSKVSIASGTASVNHQKIRIVLWLLLVLVLGIFATVLYYYNYYLIDYTEFNTSLMVHNGNSGFNTDTWELSFGKNHPGGSGTKYFSITSKERAHVFIKVSGNMSEFLSFSDNNFIIQPGETKKIQTDLKIPQDAMLGNYSGKVQVYFFRP